MHPRKESENIQLPPDPWMGFDKGRVCRICGADFVEIVPCEHVPPAVRAEIEKEGL